MIELVQPIHPTKGHKMDLFCPVVRCEVCRTPLDKDNPGNVLWVWEGDPSVMWFAHKRACTRMLENGRHLSWRDFDQWLRQLVHNYDEPLIGAKLMEDGKRITIKEVS